MGPDGPDGHERGVGRIGAGSARLLGPFALPDGLLSRVRWAFLLASLVMAAVVVLTTITSVRPTPASLRAAALVGLVFLAWRYARGYLRGGSPRSF